MRLAKCNLRCHFCDTEFETGHLYPANAVIADIHKLSSQHSCNFVVITGGEPLLQNIVPLVKALNGWGIYVSVETAGTVFCEGLQEVFASERTWRGNMIVCSPKTPKLNDKLRPLIGAFKYVVRANEMHPEDGLPIMSTQLPGEEARIYRPSMIERCTIPIYLQPCDEGDPIKNDANVKAAAAACMKHGYRLSIQSHKIAGLP
jgi:organic radical activating enzyme